MKVKCKICHRRLHAHFDATTCKNDNCPLDKGPREEVLTFENYAKPKFTIIEELNCEDRWNNTPANRYGRKWNAITNQWEDDDNVDVYGMMC
mgnify:FL=1